MENSVSNSAENTDNGMLMELTSEVVSAYVSNNPLSANDLPNLIKDVFVALNSTAGPAPVPEAEKPKPAL